jgi:hypothetical protein
MNSLSCKLKIIVFHNIFDKLKVMIKEKMSSSHLSDFRRKMRGSMRGWCKRRQGDKETKLNPLSHIGGKEKKESCTKRQHPFFSVFWFSIAANLNELRSTR